MTPASPSLGVGSHLPFTATGVYSNGTTLDLTSQATWTSSTPAVATIASTGIATGVTVGQTTISAALGAVSGATALTVTTATLTSIAVTPTAATLAITTQLQLDAVGTYSDGSTLDLTSQVTWTADASGNATVSTSGLALGVTAGAATITATLGAVSGTTVITVTSATLTSLAVTPTAPTLASGSTLQLDAVGTFSDGTTQDLSAQVTWLSDTPAIATVSTTGLLTGVTVGTANISATLGTVSGTTLVTVTTATLTQITVNPQAATLALGSQQAYTATGTYSDGSSQDVTSQATWSTSDSTVATISNATGSQGLLVVVGAGQVTVSATLAGILGGTTLTATAATLSSIAVTPTSPSVALGSTATFVATGTYSDSSTQDLSGQVTWSSSAPTVATISNAAGTVGVASALTAGSATITAQLGAVSGTTVLTVTAAALASIALNPTDPSIAKGTQQAFTAIGTFTDGSTQDVTSQATWTSTDSTVATVSNAANTQGLATAVGGGTCSISAAVGSVSGSTTLTVTGATLTTLNVSPTNPTLAKGTKVPLTATGLFSDGSSQNLTRAVTWASSDATIAAVSTVGTTAGRVTAIGAGSASVTASLSGISGSITVTVTPATLVSVSVTPTTSTLAAGSTLQFLASGTFSDGTTQGLTAQVTWSSDNAPAATISNSAATAGVATASAAGTAHILATLGGVTGSATLTVTGATLTGIQILPVNPTAATGTFEHFRATGAYSDGTTQDLTLSVTWSSGTPAVATITNADPYNGTTNNLAGGTTTITAALGSVNATTTLTVSAATLASISVTPVNPTLPIGTVRGFVATGTFSDGSTQPITGAVTWSSSDETIATVSNAPQAQGTVDALAAGSATISATASGITGSSVVAVSAATLSSIAVTPVNPTIASGTSKQFVATGSYSDGSTLNITSEVTWVSSNPAAASVSNSLGSRGLAVGLATATATSTITASLGAVSGTSTLTVTAATLSSIALSPTNPSIPNGGTQSFVATGTFSDNSTQNLTTQVSWSTSNSAIAVITTGGVATGVAAGSVTVTAQLDGQQGTTTLTVTAATLTAVQITPANPLIAVSTTKQLVATGIYSDGSTQNVTTTATWSSSDTTVATVTNTGGRGQLEGLAAGTSTITAGIGSITGSTPLTVTAATLTSIAVTPATPSVPVGTTQQFVAVGTFSDASTQTITGSVTWSSSDTTIALISNAAGSAGQSTALAAGNATITAALDGISGTATLTVAAATLSSIKITPANPSVPSGLNRQFAATGTYSDGTTQNLTASVTWTSGTTAVATISNGTGKGLATTLSPGTSVITATLNSLTATTTLTVTSATLTSIAVTPATPSIAVGATQQFKATGTYSDNSKQTLTADVTWTSSATAVATISNGTGKGLATSVASGSTTITAALGAVSGATTLTVQ